MPDEVVPALLTGRFVEDDDEEVEADPGSADWLVPVFGTDEPDEPDEEDEEEDDDPEDEGEIDPDDEPVGLVEDEEGEEVERGAIFQPLICTPTTCVEPSTVLVSDHGPESVRVK
jgi:hypothetical protein